MSRDRNQTIALAGLVQAVSLVDELARTGSANPAAQLTVVHSLFAFDADSTEAVYGRLAQLRTGLDTLGELLSGRGDAERRAIPRYAMSAIVLAGRLTRDPERLAVIRHRLETIRDVRDDDDIEAMSADIASLYQDTISTLSPRVQVSGAAGHLQNTLVADRVRALLLAAIRAAILWQQSGGRRWRLLLFRKRFASWAEILRGEASASLTG